MVLLTQPSLKGSHYCRSVNCWYKPLPLIPNAIGKRKSKKQGRKRAWASVPRPTAHPRACPDVKGRCCARRCQEPRGWAINLTQSERKIYTHSLETTPVAQVHTHKLTHTHTHTHSCPAKSSSLARTETEDKVQSQEQLNCFHDFPAAFRRQIGGLYFKCITNLHFDWLRGHANSTVKYWSVKGVWQFSTIAEMALKQTCESWGEKKKIIKKPLPDEWVLSSAKSSPSPQAWGWL